MEWREYAEAAEEAEEAEWREWFEQNIILAAAAPPTDASILDVLKELEPFDSYSLKDEDGLPVGIIAFISKADNDRQIILTAEHYMIPDGSTERPYFRPRKEINSE